MIDELDEFELEELEEVEELPPARAVTNEDEILRVLSDAAGADTELGRAAALALENRLARAERNELEASRLSMAESLESENVMDLFDAFEELRLDPDADPGLLRETAANVESARAALRAQQMADNDVANGNLLRNISALGLSEGRSEEAVEAELVEYQQAMAAEAESGRDVLEDHPLMRAYQDQRYFDQRARALAAEMSQPTEDEQLAEARSYVDSVVQGTLSGVRNG